MAQPQPPKTRQSEGRPVGDELHKMKPGGPILPKKQGYVNPGPTPNLRGVEPNTAHHKGTPNPHQSGTPGHIGGADHSPGKNSDTHGKGVSTGKYMPLRHSDVSTTVPSPTPGDVER